MKSKIATTLTGIYILLVISSYIYESTCDGQMFCKGMASLVLGAPWTWSPFLWLNYSQPDIYFYILNAIIIYFIGLGISKVISRLKKTN